MWRQVYVYGLPSVGRISTTRCPRTRSKSLESFQYLVSSYTDFCSTIHDIHISDNLNRPLLEMDSMNNIHYRVDCINRI